MPAPGYHAIRCRAGSMIRRSASSEANKSPPATPLLLRHQPPGVIPTLRGLANDNRQHGIRQQPQAGRANVHRRATASRLRTTALVRGRQSSWRPQNIRHRHSERTLHGSALWQQQESGGPPSRPLVSPVSADLPISDQPPISCWPQLSCRKAPAGPGSGSSAARTPASRTGSACAARG
jgi:hypothetical protein